MGLMSIKDSHPVLEQMLAPHVDNKLAIAAENANQALEVSAPGRHIKNNIGNTP
jgi:hypothetical protein